MIENATSGETEIELKRLDDSVGVLLNTIEQLQDENYQLRSQQEYLKIERARLMEKNELARTRVESIINRLKSMETN